MLIVIIVIVVNAWILERLKAFSRAKEMKEKLEKMKADYSKVAYPVNVC